MNIADNLKKLRYEKDLSQTDMAKKLNITRQAYNHYETEKRIPPLETLQVISDIFGVSLDYLLGKSDDPTPASTHTRKIDDKVLLLQRAAEKGMPDNELDDILSYAKYRYPERFKGIDNGDKNK